MYGSFIRKYLPTQTQVSPLTEEENHFNLYSLRIIIIITIIKNMCLSCLIMFLPQSVYVKEEKNSSSYVQELCTVVQQYSVQLYSSTLYSCTALLCTVVQHYSVQLYSITLYSCTAVHVYCCTPVPSVDAHCLTDLEEKQNISLFFVARCMLLYDFLLLLMERLVAGRAEIF